MTVCVKLIITKAPSTNAIYALQMFVDNDFISQLKHNSLSLIKYPNPYFKPIVDRLKDRRTDREAIFHNTSSDFKRPYKKVYDMEIIFTENNIFRIQSLRYNIAIITMMSFYDTM